MVPGNLFLIPVHRVCRNSDNERTALNYLPERNYWKIISNDLAVRRSQMPLKSTASNIREGTRLELPSIISFPASTRLKKI